MTASKRAAQHHSSASEDRHRIRVYKDRSLVGILIADVRGRVTFAYDEAVLDDPAAAVSVRLPPRAAPYDDHLALPCFENLLPEGDIRRLIAIAAHRAPNDVVGLLGVFGGECAGALTLWPEGEEPPAEPVYRPCVAEDLGAASGVAADVGRLANVLRDGRLSMSGAQDKLVLYRRPPVGPPAEIERSLDDVLEGTIRDVGFHPVLDRVATAVRGETGAARRALLGG